MMSVPRCIWLCHSPSLWSLWPLVPKVAASCDVPLSFVRFLSKKLVKLLGRPPTRGSEHKEYVMYIDVHSFCIHFTFICIHQNAQVCCSDTSFQISKQFLSVQGVGSDGLIKHPISACDSVPGQGQELSTCIRHSIFSQLLCRLPLDV